MLIEDCNKQRKYEINVLEQIKQKYFISNSHNYFSIRDSVHHVHESLGYCIEPLGNRLMALESCV